MLSFRGNADLQPRVLAEPPPGMGSQAPLRSGKPVSQPEELIFKDMKPRFYLEPYLPSWMIYLIYFGIIHALLSIGCQIIQTPLIILI